MAFKFKLGRNEDEHEAELDDVTKAQIAKGEQAALELETLKASIASKDSEFEQLKARLASIEEGNQQSTRQAPAGPQRTEFYEDPERAIAERISPLYQQNLTLQASIMLRQVKENHADWKFFDGEIMDIYNRCSLQQRADASVIENIYLMVKGKHSDEIREGKFLIEGSSGSSNVSPEQHKEKDLGLNPEQLRVGARLGIKPEDLAVTASKLKFV